MKIVETKWGHEKTIVNDRKYAGRLSFYKKDHASNFGCYRNQDKTYYVRQGEVEVRFGDSDRIHETLGRVYGTGDFFQVERGACFQIKALEASELIEFGTHIYEGDEYIIQEGGPF